jgi:hypothetical protein
VKGSSSFFGRGLDSLCIVSKVGRHLILPVDTWCSSLFLELYYKFKKKNNLLSFHCTHLKKINTNYITIYKFDKGHSSNWNSSSKFYKKKKKYNFQQFKSAYYKIRVKEFLLSILKNSFQSNLNGSIPVIFYNNAHHQSSHLILAAFFPQQFNLPPAGWRLYQSSRCAIGIPNIACCWYSLYFSA